MDLDDLFLNFFSFLFDLPPQTPAPHLSRHTSVPRHTCGPFASHRCTTAHLQTFRVTPVYRGTSISVMYLTGTRKRIWLRHYATSREVAGSIPVVIAFFNSLNTSSRIMALGPTQPLTEMSTRNLSGGKGRQARKADNLTAIYEPIVQKMGASTSHNPMTLHGLLQG
jgi:hypothetical protein